MIPQPEATASRDVPELSPAPPDFWAALMHRWFVQYNPAYLLSATLVLSGLWLVSRGLARDPLLGGLGVPALAELYALALIGGAAVLTRLRQRRPAVMLALLAVLYQGDLTLHVETCAYLGLAGIAASIAWLALFVAKLYALAWALELRLSRSSILVPTLGALGLAVLPHVFREVGPDVRTRLVEVWVLAVAMAGVWTSRAVESAVGFDVRGRRAIRATWMLWAALALGHVLYWWAEHGVRLVGLVPIGVLLATRWLRRERSVWALALGVLAFTVVLVPASLSITALGVALALGLRALREPRVLTPEPRFTSSSPYRAADGVFVFVPPVVELARPASATLQRLLLGAAWSTHLFGWTLGWQGGAWPAHRIVLDVALFAVCALALWRWRRGFALTPSGVVGTHLLFALGWLALPKDTLGWGLASLALGFATLAGGLLVSWRLARRAEGLREAG
jgi:hypothetical protein